MTAIFFLSFIVALTGAMAPGPLLTYTILQTMRQERRGYLVGFWVIAGHAILEGLLILLLLSGFALFVKDTLFSRIIAILGGLFLVYLGLALLLDLRRKGAPLDLSFLSSHINLSPENAAHANPARTPEPNQSWLTRFNHPLLAGIFVSMSNPYWWAWWAASGLSLMREQQISLQQGLPLVSFFLGHETGDLSWYMLVSILVFANRHWLTDRLYRLVLLICSLVMIGFGLYLGIKPLFAS